MGADRQALDGAEEPRRIGEQPAQLTADGVGEEHRHRGRARGEHMTVGVKGERGLRQEASEGGAITMVVS